MCIPTTTDGTIMISVTRLVDFLLFGRLFKACGNGFLAQIVYIIGRFLKKCHFSSESIFGQLFIDSGQLLTQAFWSPFSVMTTVYRAQAHNQASVLSE